MITQEDVRQVFSALNLEVPEPIPAWVYSAVSQILDKQPYQLSESQRHALNRERTAEHGHHHHQHLVEKDFGHIGAPKKEGRRPPPGAKLVHCIACGEEYYDDARPNEVRLPLCCPNCGSAWHD